MTTAAGVNRPMTLVDVIGTINQQDSGTEQETITGLGAFAEADENVTTGDAAFITAGTAAGWDQGQWGATQWQ